VAVILVPKFSAWIGFTTIHGAEMVCPGPAGQTAVTANHFRDDIEMKLRKLLAAPFLAVLVGLGPTNVQGAAPGSGSGTDLRGIAQNWARTAGRASLVVPSEYLEVVIRRR
jgi:hypothetical protein